MYKTILALSVLLCVHGSVTDKTADQLRSLFGHAVDKIADKKIEAFEVLGERRSGVNFISHLVKENLPSLKWYDPSALTTLHPHFIPWYLDKNKIGCTNYYNIPTRSFLYVVVIRNALDWVRSFYLRPWHVDKHAMLKGGFSHFIRHEWKPLFLKNINHYINEQEFWKNFPVKAIAGMESASLLSYWLDGSDPLTSAPFKNVLHLRNRKYQNFLALSAHVNNIVYVRYEDVAAHPQEFVDYISHLTGASCPSYKPITKEKGYLRKDYTPKTYFPLEECDRAFILSELDLKQENEFGYSY